MQHFCRAGCLPSMGRQLTNLGSIFCFLLFTNISNAQSLISASDTIFCHGDSVQLEAPGGYLYTIWSTGDTQREIYVDSAAWYYLIVADSSFNVQVDSVKIDMYPVLDFSYELSSGTQAVCKGDSLEIQLSEGFKSYSWSTGHTNPDQVFYPTDDLHLVVEAEDSNACSYRLEIHVEVLNCEDSCAELIGPDEKSVCADSIQLEASQGYELYEWTDGKTGRMRWIHESGWYILEAEDSNGSVCRDSILIHLIHAKKLEIFTNPSPPYLCKGDSVLIELTGGFKQYWWNSGHSGLRNVLYPTADKLLVIEARDSNGCDARAEVKLFVDDCKDSCDIIDVYPAYHACSGDSIKLGVQEGFDDYDWDDGVNGRFRWVKETGWYIVRAEKSNGSYCIDSVYVSFHEGQELHFWISHDTVCSGETVVVELSDNFKHYWWSSGGDGNRKVFTPTSDLNIVVEAKDSNGCEDRIEFHIEVQNCDTTCEGLIEVWPDSVACSGDSINLEAKNGYADYDWTDGKDGRIRWVKETGWYKLDAETSDGNHCYDSVYVSFYNGRELKIFSHPERAVLCPGDSIIIELSGGFVQYNWSTGHEGQRSVLHPEHSFTLVLEAIDSNGCESRASKEITVKDSCNSSIRAFETGFMVYPNPSKDAITLKIDHASMIGQEYLLCDIHGRVLARETILAYLTTVDLEAYKAGTYFLLIGGSAISIQKY